MPLVSRATPRVAGRLLLIDPADRVLLIHERTGDGSTRHWLTPGGGLEPGETPRAAAVRETYEETSIQVTLAPDATELLRLRRTWSWGGVTHDQTDHFFAARVPAGPAIEPTALTATEQETILGWRWWTIEDLRASDEVFVPGQIADLVERLTVVARTAGRVLLIDEEQRVLLIESHVDVGADATHWVTPGGGTEEDETPARAAVRELREEVGVEVAITADDVAVHVDNERFAFNGGTYMQSNHYFLARLAPGTPLRVAGVNEIERAALVGERWWTIAELRATAATVYPVGLADLLENLLSGKRSVSA